MPTGVYDRSHLVKGRKKKKGTNPNIAVSDNSFKRQKELDNIDKLIDELRQRKVAIRDEMRTTDSGRKKLLAFVEKNYLTRADVGWVYHKLPPLRVTRKRRQAKLDSKNGSAG